MDDSKASIAWIRGYTRGITNDPPDNCPDLPFDGETSGDYTEGWRLGKELSVAGKGIDRSSTLIVQGCPDGTEVTCVPQPYGADVKPEDRQKETTPLRRAIGSPANWNIYVPSMMVKKPGDCPFISIGIEPNSLIVIDFSKGSSDMLQCTYGVGPFKAVASDTPIKVG
jgi:hypothetical protein